MVYLLFYIISCRPHKMDVHAVSNMGPVVLLKDVRECWRDTFGGQVRQQVVVKNLGSAQLLWLEVDVNIKSNMVRTKS